MDKKQDKCETSIGAKKITNFCANAASKFLKGKLNWLVFVVAVTSHEMWLSLFCFLMLQVTPSMYPFMRFNFFFECKTSSCTLHLSMRLLVSHKGVLCKSFKFLAVFNFAKL